MDLAPLTDVILKQFEDASELLSLQLQNHIYGCYFVMEDLAQGVLTLSGDRVTHGSVHWNLVRDFGKIGMRYGFVMDRGLILSPIVPAYQEAWLTIFRHLASAKKIEEVDTIEDTLNALLVELIPDEQSYFIHALEKGSLNHQWIAKVLAVLDPSEETSEEMSEEQPKEPLKEESESPPLSPSSTVLTQAQTEKNRKPRRLAFTRRSKEVKKAPIRSHLGTTRRAKRL